MRQIHLVCFFLMIGATASAAGLSHIHFSLTDGQSGQAAFFSVTNPSGLTTGANSNQISGATYGIESISDDVSESITDSVINFDMRAPTIGTYTVTVGAVANTHYLLTTRLIDSIGNKASLATAAISGALIAGSTVQLTLAYDPAPGNPSNFAKSISFQILRKELTAYFELGDIGGKKFVEELDDVLAQGEKALARTNHDPNKHNDAGDNDGKREAVAKLHEFITRVNQAARARPGDHGHDQGRDDDARRFATVTAAQSLTSDANTLIAQLGGKPMSDGDDHDRNGGRH